MSDQKCLWSWYRYNFKTCNNVIIQFSLMYWGAHSLSRYSWISGSYCDFIIGQHFIVQNHWWGKQGTITADDERWFWQSHSFNWEYSNPLHKRLKLLFNYRSFLHSHFSGYLIPPIPNGIHTMCVHLKQLCHCENAVFVLLPQKLLLYCCTQENVWNETVAGN